MLVPDRIRIDCPSLASPFRKGAHQGMEMSCAGSDVLPEPSIQTETDGSLPQSPDAADAMPSPLSKSGIPPIITLQACIGALPSRATGQACLAVIRQAPGVMILTPAPTRNAQKGHERCERDKVLCNGQMNVS